MFRCFFSSRPQNRGFWAVQSTTTESNEQQNRVSSCLLSCHGGVFLPDVFSFTTLLGTKSDSDTAWRRAIVVLEQMEEIYRGVEGLMDLDMKKTPGGLGGGSSF